MIAKSSFEIIVIKKGRERGGGGGGDEETGATAFLLSGFMSEGRHGGVCARARVCDRVRGTLGVLVQINQRNLFLKKKKTRKKAQFLQQMVSIYSKMMSLRVCRLKYDRNTVLEWGVRGGGGHPKQTSAHSKPLKYGKKGVARHARPANCFGMIT